MRCCVLVLVAACGSGTASVGVSASASASASTTTAGAASSDVEVESTVDEAPDGSAPQAVDVHLHETPSYAADIDKLYVEIESDGDYADLLRKSAISGLVATDYAVQVDDGGDLELHLEISGLSPDPGMTTCAVKIFVMRMPQHDLLAIADGGASATGRNPTEQCLSATGTAIVRDKLPKIFQRQLAAKQ
jgi:hypothetical protein